jgi:hypothetical protein
MTGMPSLAARAFAAGVVAGLLLTAGFVAGLAVAEAVCG